MKKTLGYRHTLSSCYIGYVIQAIVNNFTPLLFVTFRSTYGISMENITLLIVINFSVQLSVDLIFSKLADRIGYRKCVLAAHILVTAGLISLIFLPDLFGDNALYGLLISVIIYAVGGGLLEVVISPLAEACPTEKKSSEMSLLHSFYCWGAALVILVSTLVFWAAGMDSWKILAAAWAAIPVLNGIYFCFVPVYKLDGAENKRGLAGLFGRRIFWIMLVLMLCAGAAEQIISQWASTFAELGLNVSKQIGDLAGPFAFAVLMGAARVVFSLISNKISLKKAMIFSGALCAASYLLAALSPIPVLSLVGCALAGFSVGILWPGTFSLASEKITGGGTPMFAMLAVAGDLGCAVGPMLVGFASAAFGENLSVGILFGLAFPVLLIIAMSLVKGKKPALIKPSRRKN